MLLSSYGNVPSERAANLLGVPLSAGFVDLASERLSARLEDAGFDDAMQAALAEERVLAHEPDPRPVVPHPSYLDSAAAHGLTALDAVSAALAGRPWLPALPSVALPVNFPYTEGGPHRGRR